MGGYRERLPETVQVRIIELARDGYGRNRIAEELGISVGVVSKYARLAGINFNREWTDRAIVARLLDLKLQRIEAATLLMEDFHEARERRYTATDPRERLAEARTMVAFLEAAGKAYESIAQHRIVTHADAENPLACGDWANNGATRDEEGRIVVQREPVDVEVEEVERAERAVAELEA